MEYSDETQLGDELMKMNEEPIDKKKRWKWPSRFIRNSKKASKAKDTIAVWYLRTNGTIEPMTIKVSFGDIVAIGNQCYKLKPSAIFTYRVGFKNYKVYLYRELDKMPIESSDANIEPGNSTRDDELIIKALKFAEYQGMKGKANFGGIISYIIVAVIAAGLTFMLTRAG